MSSKEQNKQSRKHAWNLNRQRRLSVGFRDTASVGSLGFAIMPKDPLVNLNSLIPNHMVEFATMRYCPPNAFPAPHNKSMTSHLASLGSASMDFGMPKIEFPDARRTFNVGLRPDERNGRHPAHPEGDVLRPDLFDREFGVFNRLSAAMDRLAFCGVDRRTNKPMQPAWYRQAGKAARPELKQGEHVWDDYDHDDIAVQDPRAWMVDAYVGVLPSDMERLYNVATEKDSDKTVRYACPECNAKHASGDFMRPHFETVWLESNFRAKCPKCHQTRLYNLDNSCESRTRRHFDLSFMIGFCEWVAEGGSLVAPCDMEYLGLDTADESYAGEEFGPKLKCHVFAVGDDEEYLMFLHESITPRVKAGQAVKQGEIVAYALEYLSVKDQLELRREWAEQPLKTRWLSLTHVLGGKDLMGFMQRLWFENQTRRIDGLIAVPTRLLGHAAGRVPTHGLWWDLSRAQDYFDAEVGAIICPPIPIKRWNRLQVNLPGQIRLDASVNDPRFNSSAFVWSENRKPQRGKKPSLADVTKERAANGSRKPEVRQGSWPVVPTKVKQKPHAKKNWVARDARSRHGSLCK